MTKKVLKSLLSAVLTLSLMATIFFSQKYDSYADDPSGTIRMSIKDDTWVLSGYNYNGCLSYEFSEEISGEFVVTSHRCVYIDHGECTGATFTLNGRNYGWGQALYPGRYSFTVTTGQGLALTSDCSYYAIETDYLIDCMGEFNNVGLGYNDGKKAVIRTICERYKGYLNGELVEDSEPDEIEGVHGPEYSYITISSLYMPYLERIFVEDGILYVYLVLSSPTPAPSKPMLNTTNIDGLEFNTWEEIIENAPKLEQPKMLEVGKKNKELLHVNILGMPDRYVPADAISAVKSSSLSGLHVFIGESDAVTFLNSGNYTNYKGIDFAHNDTFTENSRTIDFKEKGSINATVLFHSVIAPNTTGKIYKIVDGAEVLIGTAFSNDFGGICFGISDLATYVIRY